MLSKQTKARIRRNRQKDRAYSRLPNKAWRAKWVAKGMPMTFSDSITITRGVVDFPLSTSEDSSNPNNCLTCSFKQMAEEGHCYMFRDAPTEVCMQHTGRARLISPFWKTNAFDSI